MDGRVEMYLLREGGVLRGVGLGCLCVCVCVGRVG